MADFQSKYGPYALITGASSGIGEELARQVAARGLNVVLVARRAELLRALAYELASTFEVDARACVADLSDPDFLVGLMPQLEGLEIGLLINNAGYGTTGGVLDHDIEANSRMIDVNCRAPLLLTHALAPAMRDRGRGGVIITASVVGFGGAAGWATYSASKGFDLLLAEGLAAELEPHGVDVLALCPGTTRSGFQAAGGLHAIDKVPWFVRLSVLEVGPVARAALSALGRTRVVVPGLMNKLIVFSMRLSPRRLNTWITGRLIRMLSG